MLSRSFERALLAVSLVVTLSVSGVEPLSTARAITGAIEPVAQDYAYWAPVETLEGGSLDQVHNQGKTRVLVEFDTTGRDKEEMLTFLSTMKLDLLEELRRAEDDSVQGFDEFPFLSLDISEAELAQLNSLKLMFIGDNESTRIRIERSPLLFRNTSCTRAWNGYAPEEVGNLMKKLGTYTHGETGDGWRIVVIDTGVDPSNKTLMGDVLGGSVIEGSAKCFPGSYSVLEPEKGMNPATNETELDHGTMVAAIASWAAPGADIVSIRVGTENGVLVPDVIAALIEAECRWDQEETPVAAVVLCMTNKEITETTKPAHFLEMEKTINFLWEQGIPVVVSAGNDGPYTNVAFPANFENAVSVGGAINSLDERVTSSNWTSTVDLCAPGFQVAIPFPGSEWPFVKSGTSVSAPFVAGAIGLLRAAHPTCTVGSIIDALTATGKPIFDEESGVTIPLLQVAAAREELDRGCVHVGDPDVTLEDPLRVEDPPVDPGGG